MSPYTVLVTDGNNRAALAITRSLGKAGHHVFVAEKKHPSLASTSCHCQSTFRYRDPVLDANGFLDDIMRILQDNQVDVLLPVTDITTLLLSGHRSRIEKYCYFPFSEHCALMDAADKSKIIMLSRELNIPHPSTHILNGKGDLISGKDLNFPMVVKPSRSRILLNNSWIFTNVTYAENSKQLKEIVQNMPEDAFPLLLQERITGPGIGVFAYYHHGKLRALFGHRRLREKPPSGGVSTLRESVTIDPQIRKYSESILNHFRWHGVAMVEYKVDRRDNQPKIMEINGRFWGSLQLAIDAGVDFPALLVDAVSKEDIEPQLEFKSGVRTRWFLGDLDAFLMVLIKNRRKLDLPENFPSKLRYTIDFLKLWGQNLHYEIESWRDMRPGLFEFGNWIRGRTI